MRYSFSDEQEAFRAQVRRFLDQYSSSDAVRRVMDSDSGYDGDTWRRLGTDLGLPGVHLSEDYGGLGFGFEELGIALEEMGRTLLCAPFFATSVLAARTLVHGATAAEQAQWLTPLATGAQTATLAWQESAQAWNEVGETRAAVDGDGVYRLHGTKCYVVDGASAERIFVFAREGDGIALCVVDGAAAGLARRPLATIDRTRRLAQLVFDGAPAQRLGPPGCAAGVLARVLDEAAVALACEMIGGARRVLADAVAYAGLRMQFGRPIGSFQAIKHKCADCLLEVELAAAAVARAAAAIDAGEDGVPAFAAQAKAMAADAYMHAAAEGIQIHGGIGFTWDHDAHLWYKRAKSSEVFLGAAAAHRERYLAAVEAAA